MKYTILLLIPLMSYFDRARGNHENPIPKPLALAVLGVCVALLSGLDPKTWTFFLFALGVAAGWNIWGWGHPLGWALDGAPAGEYEGWQVGPLRENPWLALSALGVLHGTVTLIAWQPALTLKFTLVMMIAYPAAPAIARFIFNKPGGAGWGLQEYIRSALVGTGVLLCSFRQVLGG